MQAGGGVRHSLSYRLNLLRNKLFLKRYILRNIYHSYQSIVGYYNPKYSIRTFISFAALAIPLGLYFSLRFLRGKVDMPYFEVVMTTRCTMRCEACSDMMQYFSKDTYYTCTLGKIKESMDAILGTVDSVQRARIIGGEPLLHKDLAQVALYLRKSPKVKSFDIVTNATLDFKEDVLTVLEGARKAWVTISDYSASPNLAVPLRQESIIAALKAHKIAYYMSFMSFSNGQWWDPGKIYKRNRSKEDIVKNYRACMESCVSVMSAECAKDANLAPLGAAFICPIASSLSRLKGLAEVEGDFIDLATATKESFIDFYAQDYFKACDYCCNKWEKPRFIPPAVQTKEVFSLSADS